MSESYVELLVKKKENAKRQHFKRTDDRRSCDDHYSVDLYLYRRSETADQRYVLGSC